MNRLTVTSLVIILMHASLSVLANVKITPIAVDNKSNIKSDLKSEEARFRDPIMPEYYDRNRNQNFVTSNYDSYSGSAYDRYGYNNPMNTNNNFDRLQSTYDRYGVRYPGSPASTFDGSRERFGSNYGVNGLDNKFGLMGGGSYGTKYPYNPANVNSGGPVFGPYGNPSSGGQQAGGYGPQMGNGMFSTFGGILPPELEQKTSVLLPLAGAALLGIATYALVTNPGIAATGPILGKRRRRSLFDEKLEQHLAFRAHKNTHKVM